MRNMAKPIVRNNVKKKRNMYIDRIDNIKICIILKIITIKKEKIH